MKTTNSTCNHVSLTHDASCGKRTLSCKIYNDESEVIAQYSLRETSPSGIMGHNRADDFGFIWAAETGGREVNGMSYCKRRSYKVAVGKSGYIYTTHSEVQLDLQLVDLLEENSLNPAVRCYPGLRKFYPARLQNRKEFFNANPEIYKLHCACYKMAALGDESVLEKYLEESGLSYEITKR